MTTHTPIQDVRKVAKMVKETPGVTMAYAFTVLNKLLKDGFEVEVTPLHVKCMDRGTITIRDTKLPQSQYASWAYQPKERYVHYTFNGNTGYVRRYVPWHSIVNHPLNKPNMVTKTLKRGYSYQYQQGYKVDKDMNVFQMIEKYYHRLLSYRTYMGIK